MEHSHVLLLSILPRNSLSSAPGGDKVFLERCSLRLHRTIAVYPAGKVGKEELAEDRPLAAILWLDRALPERAGGVGLGKSNPDAVPLPLLKRVGDHAMASNALSAETRAICAQLALGPHRANRFVGHGIVRVPT